MEAFRRGVGGSHHLATNARWRCCGTSSLHFLQGQRWAQTQASTPTKRGVQVVRSAWKDDPPPSTENLSLPMQQGTAT